MKKYFLLLLIFCNCSLLLAQKKGSDSAQPVFGTRPTNIYLETFDDVEGKYGWRRNADYIIQNGAYQISSAKEEGKVYMTLALPYNFRFKKEQDWALEMDLKKVAGDILSQ